jgi:HK97 family phage major capsid protein/HK97 family phage prohead protease
VTAERRDLTSEVEIRATGDTFVLRGYAYVFDKLSHDLGGFRERIEKGAGREDMERGELVATFNHNASAPLGRTGYGLRTGVDDHGGWYEVDLPNTTAGRDVAELVKRRIVRGSSFTFRLKDVEADQEWTRDEATGFLIRTVRDFHVAELGPVTSPAYPDTTAAKRSIPDALRELISQEPARVPSVEVKEGTPPMTSNLKDTAEERLKAEHALQGAADAGRSDVEARILEVLDRLDTRYAEQDAEQRATAKADEIRSTLLELLEKHQVSGFLPKGADDATQLRALTPGQTAEFRAVMGVKVDATNAQEGIVRPEKSLFDSLMEVIGERSSIITRGARIITTRSGEVIEFPKVTPTPSTGRPTEAGPIPENYPETDKVELGVGKYGHLTWVSTELTEEDAVGLIDFLVRDAGPNIADQMNRDFIAALLDPVKGIAGSLRFAPATLASEVEIGDHIIDAFYSLPAALSGRATWMTGRETVARLRKIKDSDGRYFLKSIADGGGLTLLDRPVDVDPGLAGANANKIVLSDLSGFTVRYVGSLRVARSTDAKFADDQVGFRFVHRAGGALLDATGSVLLTLPVEAP